MIIWRWNSAPEMYRNLSVYGGDEDWVIVGMEDEVEDMRTWGEKMSYDGNINIVKHPHTHEYILILAHA
jgi:hypothetical protein